jgi:hypothetical protein
MSVMKTRPVGPRLIVITNDVGISPPYSACFLIISKIRFNVYST